jgi:cobalt/nickel transport system ATP-binding protein
LAALASLGLEALAGVEASQLSLGQRKRAAIAAALVQAPDLLVLDEPTSELDPRSARRLVETLNGLSCARLIASHDMEFLRQTTELIWILDGGLIAVSGRTGEVLGDRATLLLHGLA